MASKRSIPTHLFSSPDFFELSSNTTRLILIGIILDADDEGRGSAHSQLLARKLNEQEAQIEGALIELEEHGILQCYQVQGRGYYTLCHWHKYQTLSKPTPSQYPAPHQEQRQHASDPHSIGYFIPSLENPGQSRETPLEEEGEKEQEQEENRTEGEDEGSQPNVVHFPTFPHAPTRGNDNTSCSEQEKILATTTTVAHTLHLPVTENLVRIVQEFLSNDHISVVGEAIEARAWIDDPLHNQRRKLMTLAFFRRWLKRERDGYRQVFLQRLRTSEAREESHAFPAADNGKAYSDPYREFVLSRSRTHSGQSGQEVAS